MRQRRAARTCYELSRTWRDVLLALEKRVFAPIVFFPFVKAGFWRPSASAMPIACLVALSKLASWGSRGLDRSEGWRGLEGNMSRFDTAEKIVDYDVRYCDGGTLEL
jgi:hypothetical protein